jgi:hypothetical protein
MQNVMFCKRQNWETEKDQQLAGVGEGRVEWAEPRSLGAVKRLCGTLE